MGVMDWMWMFGLENHAGLKESKLLVLLLLDLQSQLLSPLEIS